MNDKWQGWELNPLLMGYEPNVQPLHFPATWSRLLGYLPNAHSVNGDQPAGLVAQVLATQTRQCRCLNQATPNWLHHAGRAAWDDGTGVKRLTKAIRFRGLTSIAGNYSVKRGRKRGAMCWEPQRKPASCCVACPTALLPCPAQTDCHSAAARSPYPATCFH